MLLGLFPNPLVPKLPTRPHTFTRATSTRKVARLHGNSGDGDFQYMGIWQQRPAYRRGRCGEQRMTSDTYTRTGPIFCKAYLYPAFGVTNKNLRVTPGAVAPPANPGVAVRDSCWLFWTDGGWTMALDHGKTKGPRLRSQPVHQVSTAMHGMSFPKVVSCWWLSRIPKHNNKPLQGANMCKPCTLKNDYKTSHRHSFNRFRVWCKQDCFHVRNGRIQTIVAFLMYVGPVGNAADPAVDGRGFPRKNMAEIWAIASVVSSELRPTPKFQRSVAIPWDSQKYIANGFWKQLPVSHQDQALHLNWSWISLNIHLDASSERTPQQSVTICEWFAANVILEIAIYICVCHFLSNTFFAHCLKRLKRFFLAYVLHITCFPRWAFPYSYIPNQATGIPPAGIWAAPALPRSGAMAGRPDLPSERPTIGSPRRFGMFELKLKQHWSLILMNLKLYAVFWCIYFEDV